MKAREVNYEDSLTSVLVRSKKFMNEGMPVDSKLNYRKIYDNPKEYEVSYVDALANLEEIKELFIKRILEKNKHYNFFLDDSETSELVCGISADEYNKYQMEFKEGKIYAYCLRNTWTKGKEFFFIEKGSVIEIKFVYEDRIFADVRQKDMVGLMKLVDLKLIFTKDEDE